MSSCSSDDEKVIDFQIHRLCQSLKLWQSVAPQILQINSD